jgi:regulator of sigma E protease
VTTIINIAEFIIALSVLAFIHEMGHYLLARLFKIEVEEFGLGFPPRLVKLFTLGGTEFTLNAIPFGAFVRPRGENDPEVAGGLAAANPWARLGVLFGGPVFNLITGILLFSMVFVRTGMPDSSVVQIIGVSQNSPAQTAGLKAGDIILKINGQPINSMERLSALVKEGSGKEISILVKRENVETEIKATPRLNPPAGQGALGISMGNPNIPISWNEAVPYAAQLTYEQSKQLFLLPGRLIQGTISADQARVVGPKGMYDIYAQARTRDEEISAENNPSNPAVNTLWLLATISVALGITNLLPLPALDGGRILFVLPEIILRRRVPAQFENMIHLVGFALLILFMVYVTTQDIINPIILP